MIDWTFLIDEAALASVLPDDQGYLRRPISGALAVFLGGLTPARQAAILADQAALSAKASPSERLALLARGCPTLHKLGQVLARDQRLDLELRRHLQELESLPPSVPLEVIEKILNQEVGDLDRLGVKLQPPALAEASVAVVLPFQVDSRHGVFKVLKPGILERLEEELALFDAVGAYLDQRCDEFAIPHLDYRDSFEQVSHKLRNEVRFDLEQEHLAEARKVFQADSRVLIPALFDLCTCRLTAMERVWGRKVTDPGLHPRVSAGQLANLVLEALIAQPFFSRADNALYHGDPHPGNLFLTDDGRLALLDWSLAGRLGEEERVAMVQVILGALSLDVGQVASALQGLASGSPVDRVALESVVRVWLGHLRQGKLPGFTWLVDLLDDAVLQAGLRVRPDLMLYRKALHTLEGVVNDIGASEDRSPNLTDNLLFMQFLHHLVVEWPLRWFARPGSRAFATRLSNADLGALILNLPLSVTRFWLGSADSR